MYLNILMIVFAIMLSVGAAHRRRRKYRRYLKGRIDFELALGTLAANDVIAGQETNTLSEQAWLTSVKATWSLNGFTPVAGDGPLWVGVAHSDYTAGEIEEWIEEGASWDTGDQLAREKNQRKIRQVGVFAASGSGADIEVLNDGRPIRTKCGWQLDSAQTLGIWVYNSGAGALTTGALIHVNGHANLWPN